MSTVKAWSTGRVDGNNNGAICLSCGGKAYLKPRIGCQTIQHTKTWEAKKRLMLRRFHRLQRAALVAYGGKCACCGFADVDAKIQTKSVLSLDHVHGDGRKDNNFTLIARLARQKYPMDGKIRVLCRGCNSMIAAGADKCLLHRDTVN